MVTAIQACPHVVFRKLPNIEFLTFYFIANKSGWTWYYILYISIMLKHLRATFLHFGLKNRNRLSEYEFYSWAD